MVDETEIIQFMKELEEIMEVSTRINFKYKFDPMLFYLWKINKEVGYADIEQTDMPEM